jgi:hypothetical protein
MLLSACLRLRQAGASRARGCAARGSGVARRRIAEGAAPTRRVDAAAGGPGHRRISVSPRELRRAAGARGLRPRSAWPTPRPCGLRRHGGALEAAQSLRHAATQAEQEELQWQGEQQGGGQHDRAQHSPKWSRRQRQQRGQAAPGGRPPAAGAAAAAGGRGPGYWLDPVASQQQEQAHKHHQMSQAVIAAVTEHNAAAAAAGGQPRDLGALAGALARAVRDFSSSLPSGLLVLRPPVLRALLGPCLEEMAARDLAEALEPHAAGAARVLARLRGRRLPFGRPSGPAGGERHRALPPCCNPAQRCTCGCCGRRSSDCSSARRQQAARPPTTPAPTTPGCRRWRARCWAPGPATAPRRCLARTAGGAVRSKPAQLAWCPAPAAWQAGSPARWRPSRHRRPTGAGCEGGAAGAHGPQPGCCSAPAPSLPARPPRRAAPRCRNLAPAAWLAHHYLRPEQLPDGFWPALAARSRTVARHLAPPELRELLRCFAARGMVPEAQRVGCQAAGLPPLGRRWLPRLQGWSAMQRWPPPALLGRLLSARDPPAARCPLPAAAVGGAAAGGERQQGAHRRVLRSGAAGGAAAGARAGAPAGPHAGGSRSGRRRRRCAAGRALGAGQP